MAHVNAAMKTSLSVFRATPVVTHKTNQGNATSDATPSMDSSGTSNNGAADFRTLFTAHSNPPTPASAPSTGTSSPGDPAPTAQSLFGPNPWMTNPGGVGPNGVSYSYNPYYFATAQTAAKVAQMVGGTVVQQNAITPYGPFPQNQPNYMVQLPNGRQINAGLFASFYDHGYTQDFVNRLVTSELNDTSA